MPAARKGLDGGSIPGNKLPGGYGVVADFVADVNQQVSLVLVDGGWTKTAGCTQK